MNDSKRLDAIQILRAIAFIAIFLSHVDVIGSGMFGVSVFLILSGFCMTYSYFNREILQITGIKENISFAWNRVKKLYPLHFLTLIAVAAVMRLGLMNSDLPKQETLYYFIMNAVLLQCLIPWRDGYFSFNAVSWYLSVYMICCFFFPWILNKLRKSQYVKVIQIAIVTIVVQVGISLILYLMNLASMVDDDIIKWVTYISPFYRLGDIIVGAVFGWMYVKETILKNRLSCYHASAVVALMAILGIQLFLYKQCDIPKAFVFDLYWLPVSLAFVCVFAWWGDIRKNLLTKSLMYIGNISGYAFLIHQIMIKFVQLFSANKTIVTVVAFLGTIICTEMFIWMERTCKSLFCRRYRG